MAIKIEIDTNKDAKTSSKFKILKASEIFSSMGPATLSEYGVKLQKALILEEALKHTKEDGVTEIRKAEIIEDLKAVCEENKIDQKQLQFIGPQFKELANKINGVDIKASQMSREGLKY
jgi:hypothetical protein